MVNINRCLKMNLSQGKSAFLWGPRKTGKSTFLRQNFPNSLYFDFLEHDLYLDLVKRPSLLRQEIDKQIAAIQGPVIIDEVQKIPAILDEVHLMIEKMHIGFILCGSSARKLKRGQANLLGGRAWRFEMFPLVSAEIDHMDLLRALNNGLIPAHYIEHQVKRDLKAYAYDYLKEEVFEEGLTRNIPAFSRFFEAMAYSHGQTTNFSNIARDCGVDAKTVREYYQILEDTLLGRMVEPFKRRQDRNVILRIPKFYLFDVGLAGALIHREIKEEKGEEFGRAFEHLIFMELRAYNSYKELDFNINYWRTKSGLEVDFILAKGEVAIEVKGSSRVDYLDIKGLINFNDEYKPKKAIVVTNERAGRIEKGIIFMPWREFLQQLWKGKIL